MCQDLPTDGFKWISNVDEFSEKRIAKLVEKNKYGYLLEVDIDYPERLHDKHNGLPFSPERMTINKVEKLVPNLKNKRGYVVHIRALNEAIKHWLELKKVHRVIQFNQEPWLKGYINHNMRLRTAAKNDFEKYFYKLMNLSVLNKTMENIRNHRNIQLVTNEDKCRDGEDGGQSEQSRCIYARQSWTCQIMYKFHYDFMHPKYGSKLQLCYMDTDSLCNIRTEDFYRDIAQDVEDRFDTNAYNLDDGRPLPLGNKKGLMKDELGGKSMTEFITLRAKLYAYESLTKEDGNRKAKGVKRCVTKKSITFNDYRRCLEEGIDI
ncbi:uncharacterized protein LOC130648089 [Hydractinia symbiolongicarpus]|uniref:uncharacterized protein LOC130648089 n=1 Tax=Hydractinia symbiolongicarpus TaxID=13093 RepID=UPI00254CEA68|nr:uncharacterized protein LOC130648089 [Hydractinia symbiolongicarpus]